MDYYGSTSLKHTVAGGVRALWRFHRVALTFVLLSLLAVLARAVVRRPSPRSQARLRRWIGRRLTTACGIRVTRRGSRPTGARLLVSNHLSWADSFVFLGESGARFVADSVYREVPVLRTVLAAVGMLFINRKSLREIRDVGAHVGRGVLAGDTLMIFPEADTTRGAAVNRFRPGLLEPAATAELPVWWAALRYQTPAGWPDASRVVAWADWTPLLVHMYRAFHVPMIVAEICYGAEPIAASSRKVLALRLERAVRSAHRPLSPPSADLKDAAPR